MNANLIITIESSKTEIQDLLSQICVVVPDCKKFNIEIFSPTEFSYLITDQAKLDIVAERELIQEIMEIVNNAKVGNAESVVKMEF